MRYARLHHLEGLSIKLLLSRELFTLENHLRIGQGDLLQLQPSTVHSVHVHSQYRKSSVLTDIFNSNKQIPLKQRGLSNN